MQNKDWATVIQSTAPDHKVPRKPPNCILCLTAVVPDTDWVSLPAPRLDARLAWDCLLSSPEYLILHKHHPTCAAFALNTRVDTVRAHVLLVKVYWAYWFTPEQTPVLRPPARLPLYGPIDLHQSVRSRTEETAWNTQAGPTRLPHKRLWMDERLQDPRDTVDLRAVCHDAEFSMKPMQTASVRSAESEPND